jgi:NAD kinase
MKSQKHSQAPRQGAAPAARRPGADAAQRPRVVIVTRKTGLEALLENQGTRGQAAFFLKARGQSIKSFEVGHERFRSNLAGVLSAIPSDQRRVHVERERVDRFLFAPDDIVLVVGQDGLVPNAAKYLDGQLVIGVNPDPSQHDGVLCRHAPAQIGELIAFAEATLAAGGEPPGDAPFALERRSMAVAERDDGLKLLALNEVFVGHQSHQSARYRLLLEGSGEGQSTSEERQSSSGLICATGTGCTGWARSIAEQRGLDVPLPSPGERTLAWFVREPFPSVSTGTALDHGLLRGEERLTIFSEMGEGGVAFADGIESDRLDFQSGQVLRIGLAERALTLVVPNT